MNGEDLDAIDAAPAKDDTHCLLCAREWWACLCSPDEPGKRFTPEELEADREQRLVRAERKAGSE